ncbi:hypothetical protein [Arcanobacterium phocae]|uniref:hypothetical protein n=1 Tax=Arcanobacterium phocae TaxID=131112 RepID=UPI001C0ECF2B|nr:hypothetical protein [Arcanobacterium phocae]
MITLGGYEIRPIDADHFLNDFTCGYDDNRLGDWLSNRAFEEDQKNLSRVWIMSEVATPGVPVGYFSLSEHLVLGSSLTKKLRDGISESRQHPARLLGKFALHVENQKRGLGRFLMLGAFQAHLLANKYSAARFLVLHVRNEPLIEYYKRYGFKLVNDSSSQENFMCIPTAVIKEIVDNILAD